MAGSAGYREPGGASQGLEPGTLSRLLLEIAGGPDDLLGEAWGPVLHAGSVVGRFELVRELGRGGFGVVWEARDRELGRSVAFKAVRAGGKTGLREERLLREAEAAARLSHPNIVTLFDVGRSEHGPYLVLELLRGRTLEDRLADGPLPPREATGVASEVAKGLAHAHAGGVVHRDLKPENVFLCQDGQVKVLDFGLAHAFGRRRQDGGTPAYMAPEQMAGAPEDERTDIFALGVMLFEMLSGKLPFPDAKALASSSPAPLLEVSEAPALGELVGRMLAKEPVGRPRDGGSVREALSSIRDALARAGPSPAPVRVRRRLPRLAVMGLLAAVLGAALAAVVVLYLRKPVEAVPAADGRITVAVADFANETGERELDSISGLLLTALEQSSQLRVLTRSRMHDVLKQLGKGEVERIDEPLAREVGRRTGTRALLLATVRKLGDTYAVELRALDPVKDEYLFTARDRAPSKEALFDLVDRLGESARGKLLGAAGPGTGAGRGVASITTGNLKAWDLLFRAREAIDRSRSDEARRLLDAALEADPEFALAHYQRALVSSGNIVWEIHGWPPIYLEPGRDTRPAAYDHVEAAAKVSERLPEKERLSLLATAAWNQGRRMQAKELRDRVAEAYPLDKEALFYAGDARLHMSEAADSMAYFERALQLDPGYVVAAELLAEARALTGRARDHLPWLRRQVGGGVHPRIVVSGLLAAGEEGEGLELARKADDPWLAGLTAAFFHVFRGRAADAEAAVRAALAGLSSEETGKHGTVERKTTAGAGRRAPPPREMYNGVLALTLAAQGRFAEAGRRLEERRRRQLPGPDALLRLWLSSATRSPSGLRAALTDLERLDVHADPTLAPDAVVALVHGGDVIAATRLATAARGSPMWNEFALVDRQLIGAVAAWGEGAGDRAESELRAVADHAEVFVRYLGLLTLGHLASARAACTTAVAAFERARGLGWSPGMNGRFWTYPGLLHSLGVCYERTGYFAKARERNDELLSLWQRADLDLPLLAEAKALRARLAAAK